MPKPLFGDNGSGMHTHQSLWNDGKPLFYDEAGYGGLSDIARWYIGGLLKHAPVAARLHEPDDRTLPPPRARLRGAGEPRLLGGQPLGGHPHPDHGHQPEGEAHRVPRARRVRQPVPRVRRAADGRHRRHPEPHRAARAGRQGPLRAAAGRGASLIPQVPGSLDAVLDALEADHDFLTAGNVFTPEADRDLDRLQAREGDQAARRSARTPSSTSSTSGCSQITGQNGR